MSNTLMQYLMNPSLMQQLPQIQQVAPTNYIQPMKPVGMPQAAPQQDSGTDIGSLVGTGMNLWNKLKKPAGVTGTHPVDYIPGRGPMARGSLPAQTGPSFLNNFGGLY